MAFDPKEHRAKPEIKARAAELRKSPERRTKENATARERYRDPEVWARRSAKQKEYRQANLERIRAQEREYYAKNAEKLSRQSADHARRRRYGLSPDDIQRMRDEQGGRCRICEDLLGEGRAMAVDHCHTTGRVRALLCTGCNTGLGSFKERTDSLLRAKAYLELFNVGG